MDALEKKITDAMHRIEELYHETDGKCYMSFSGGKDSTIILALIKMCTEIYTLPAEGIRAVFCDTGIELGATREFVKWCRENYYPNIETIRPEKPFAWVITNKGKPLKSKIRSEMLNRWHRLKKIESKEKFESRPVFEKLTQKKNKDGAPHRYTNIADKDMHMLHDNFDIIPSAKCCQILKKDPMSKYATENGMKGYITGVRSDEGGARQMQARRRESKQQKLCTVIRGEFILKMPIIDWTDDDVEEFIRRYNVPMSKAYTLYGKTRTGCMGCPYSKELAFDLKILYEYEPNRYKASMHWLKDVYIAQGVELPFDEAYEEERKKKWNDDYFEMRNEMLKLYRPNAKLTVTDKQMTIDDFLGEQK